MPIRKRKIVPRKKRAEKQTPAEILDRMGAILEAGHGTQEMANIYFTEMAKLEVNRMQSIVARAYDDKSWDFMEGCYTQAMTLYVLASVLYEKHPEHQIMTDGTFDKLGRWLFKRWKRLSREFRSWYNITAIDLSAGTGHAVQEDTHIRFMVAEITGEPINVKSTRFLRRRSKSGRPASTGKPRRKGKRPIRRPKGSKRG